MRYSKGKSGERNKKVEEMDAVCKRAIYRELVNLKLS